LKLGCLFSIQNSRRRAADAPLRIGAHRNNILTYCRQADQISALVWILDCLAPEGLFITGCHEVLPHEIAELAAMVECPFVYRKK